LYGPGKAKDMTKEAVSPPFPVPERSREDVCRPLVHHWIEDILLRVARQLRIEVSLRVLCAGWATRMLPHGKPLA
jgi:hypothetical protein